MIALTFFLLAFFLGTLIEYVAHRLMHAGVLFPCQHWQHHKARHARGWFWEFGQYLLFLSPLLWLGFLHSRSAGVGFLVGGLVYLVLVAYSHQLQHEHPERAFWLKRPVHYLHHRHDRGQYNYGVLVDIWDRLLGTYKPYDWQRPPGARFSLRGLLDIKWI
jgi:sterol desaturase/sphingolipid hydroxylase (fatty acid hydroxylase superfamily)